MTESAITSVMQNLKCTREQAIQVLQDDQAIDKGQRMDFDLSPEQEKLAKKYANAREHKRTAYQFTKRERKPNETKRHLIKMLADYLAGEGITPAITNQERQIAFECDGNKYELTLVQKRPPKQ